MKKFSKAQLKKLMKEWTEQLDDSDRDETYGTEKSLAYGVLNNFLDWLDIKYSKKATTN